MNDKVIPRIQFGFSRESFRQTKFEQTPYYHNSAFDASAFSWDLIDRALDLQDLSGDRLKVLKTGRIDPAQYIEDFVDIGIRRRRVAKHVLYRLLSQGATVVLNRIELVSPAVQQICLDVGQFVGTQTTANAYASLGSEPATNIHWDTHDVFVVQLRGRKRWRLYEPTLSLPLSNQISNERKDEVPACSAMDIQLEAGSILYVPRGWWHKVEPIEGSDTIHLTVAIHTPLILDYIIWATANVFPDDEAFRHGLFGSAMDRQHIAEAVAKIERLLKDEDTIGAFHQRNRERDRVISPFNIHGLISSSPQLRSQTLLTVNTRTSISRSSGVTVNGTKCEATGVSRELLERITLTGSVTYSAILEELGTSRAAELAEAAIELARADVIQISSS